MISDLFLCHFLVNCDLISSLRFSGGQSFVAIIYLHSLQLLIVCYMRRNGIQTSYNSRVEMQTEFHYRLFLVLLGFVFQEESPFCWTPANTVRSFLFCEVIESLGCKIRQGCKKTSRRRQHCAEFTQRLLTALLLCAIFWWHASAYCWNVGQTGGLFEPCSGWRNAQAPWEPKSFQITAHSCVACQECLTFSPQSLNQLARRGCLCSQVCQETVLLIIIFLSYKGIFKMQ